LPLLAAALPWIVGGLGAAASVTSVAKNIKDMVQSKGKGIISDLGIPIISPLAAKIGLGECKLIGGRGLKYKKRGKGGVFLNPEIYGKGGVFLNPRVGCSGNPFS